MKIYAVFSVVFATLLSPACYGQVVVTQCPPGYHLDIVASDRLTALRQSLDDDDQNSAAWEANRDKYDSATVTAAQEAISQNHSNNVSHLLEEQSSNIRCVAN